MMVDHYWRIPYGSTERSECDEILNELKPWMGIYWEINKFYENR